MNKKQKKAIKSIKNKYLIFENKQKNLFPSEVWHPDRDLLDIPKIRGIFISKPNGGKTLMVMNIIAHAEKQYDKIYLCHMESMNTERKKKKKKDENEEEDDKEDVDELGYPEEYKLLEESGYELILLKKIPLPGYFKRGMYDDENDPEHKHPLKCLIILDDVKIPDFTKQQLNRLEKIESYVCSHYYCNLLITTQLSVGSLPTSIMRLLNVFVLWRTEDLAYLKHILNRVGIEKRDYDKFVSLIQTFGLHDNLMIDDTENSPARFRKNCYTKLDL